VDIVQTRQQPLGEQREPFLAMYGDKLGAQVDDVIPQNPLDSPNAEFLYLYGRANLLTGNTDEASKAFDAAIAKSDLNPSPATATIKKESVLGLSLISVRTQTQRDRWKVLNHYEQMKQPTSNAP